MKMYLFSAFFLSVLLLSCKQDAPVAPPPVPAPPPFTPVGKWIANDIEIDFEIDCRRCQQEEKDMVKAMMKSYIDGMKSSMLQGAYIEFFKDMTYRTEAQNEADHGQYKLINDGSSIETETKSDNGLEKEYIAIKKVMKDGKETVELLVKLPASDLAEMTESQNIPDLGKVTFRITTLEMKFTRA